MSRPGRGELHRVLKPESVSLLVQIFGGGRSFRVPASTAHAEHIELAIGAEQTARLVENLGGLYVYLPHLGARQYPKWRTELPPTLQDVERLSKGPNRLSAAKIAALYGCSARAVYYKRRRLRAPTDNQLQIETGSKSKRKSEE